MKHSNIFSFLYENEESVPALIEKVLKELEPKKEEKPNMTINIEISLPKSQPKPKRKVRVFSNFVKVGWNQYSIKIDHYTGYEYVLINGVRYDVVRNVFGQGYLVEI